MLTRLTAHGVYVTLEAHQHFCWEPLHRDGHDSGHDIAFGVRQNRAVGTRIGRPWRVAQMTSTSAHANAKRAK